MDDNWKNTFDLLPDIIAVMDADHKIVRMNKAMAERLEKPAEFFVDKQCFCHLHDTDNPPPFCPHQRALASGEVETEEVYLEKWDKHFAVTAYPLFDDKGTVTGSIHVGRDITELNRAKHSLQTAVQKLQTTLDALPDFLFEIDRESRVYDCRVPDEGLLYVSVDQLMHKTVHEFLPREAADIITNAIELALVQGFHRGSTYSLKLGEQTHWFELSINARSAKKNPDEHLIVLARDVTERKQSESFLEMQRELGIKLSSTFDLPSAMELCMDTVLQVDGIDAGGIYLVDQDNGTLDLAVQRALSPQFIASATDYEPFSKQFQSLMRGKPIYRTFSEYLQADTKIYEEENLHGIVVVPVFHEDRVIASFNLASYSEEEIPQNTRNVVETIATQIGGAIARLQTEQQLRESQGKLQTLSGLLPICSKCKKIRNDHGYWEQIETYISEHSEAEFTHGMCSDCLEETYSAEGWYKKTQNKKVDKKEE